MTHRRNALLAQIAYERQPGQEGRITPQDSTLTPEQRQAFSELLLKERIREAQDRIRGVGHPVGWVAFWFFVPTAVMIWLVPHAWYSAPLDIAIVLLQCWKILKAIRRSLRWAQFLGSPAYDQFVAEVSASSARSPK
jgi:hypothetical protein